VQDLGGRLSALSGWMQAIPYSLVALLARFALAATFWKSGQTKVQGFAVDLIEGRFELGLPRLADATVELFRDEYRLPLAPPELAAFAASVAEHVFPILLLLGLATRFSALSLLIMTAVIQIFVYPGAYPLHAAWAAGLLTLMTRGPGLLSVDHALTPRL
jgi:putative oxidoreductase